jgi:hypothetical protein
VLGYEARKMRDRERRRRRRRRRSDGGCFVKEKENEVMAEIESWGDR